MSPILITVLCYLLLINLTAAFITIYDKHQAKIKKWRVPEKSLLFLSALGGSTGMYITMKLIRHKTQKAKFMVGIPIIFCLQFALLCGIFYLWKNGFLF